MGLFDKVKGMMGVPDDEEDYSYDDYQQESEEYEQQPSNNYSRQTESASSPDETKRSNKVVNINSTMQLQVVLVKPERFDDASQIADHLNSKRTVVLNLEGTSKEVSRRLVDFLSGVAYANNGQIKRIANSTFIITPYNVDLMGDLLDELESNGVFFG
ncbi:MAG: cell division protein SepF [Clostridia bacterium]|jgi:cell division inhibitor SepF|nr:cell division protein SepF [Clostridia bacterium]NLS85857.1 cell division protein SepF [Oscillospiraceae bacterium]